VIVLLVAPPINLMVAVPEVFETVVLAIVRELPPAFKPLIVTLSAPLKIDQGTAAAIAPEIVRAAPPAGAIKALVYDAEPDPTGIEHRWHRLCCIRTYVDR
jgi:hypothetical protein